MTNGMRSKAKTIESSGRLPLRRPNNYILHVHESFKIYIRYLFSSSLYRVFIFLLLEMYGTFKKALKTRNVTDSIVVQNAIRAEE